MALLWYEADGTTPVTAPHAFGPSAAGVASTPWEPWIEYTGGPAAENLKLGVQALNGATYVWTGLSVVDQHETEIRIKGYDNTGDPTWIPDVTTLASRVGAGLPFSAGRIPGDCRIQLAIAHHPRNQSGTSPTDVTVQFVPTFNEIATALGVGVNEASGYGVLTGVSDPYVSEWVEAPVATETGTPDDYVQVPRGWHTGNGVPRRRLASPHQLNQNDSAAAALAAGQAYAALVSQPLVGGARVVTKGVKAAAGSQLVPALPANSLPVCSVVVPYGAGGSVITQANITQLAFDGRLRVIDAGGLDVTIRPGRALVRRALIERTLSADETVTDDATTTLYLALDGSLSQTEGDFALAEVTAAAGDITGIVERRPFVEPGLEVVRLGVAGNEATGTAVASAYVGRRSYLDRVSFAVRTASTGATGSTIVDVNVGGTTVFTGQGGAVESRPTIAAQGTQDLTAYPEVTVIPAGSWLTLDVDAITSGGSRAADLEVLLWLSPA